MNSLKGLFVVAVLAALACGMYISLNRKPEGPPPPGAPQGAMVPPKTQGVPPLSVGAGPTAPGNAGRTAGALAPGFPAMPAAGSGAPQNSVNPPAATANTSAPPYNANSRSSPAALGSVAPALGPMAPAAGPESLSDPAGSLSPPLAAGASAAEASKAGSAVPYPSSGAPASSLGAAIPGAPTQVAASDPNARKSGSLTLSSDNLARYGLPPAAPRDANPPSKFDAVMKSVNMSMEDGKLAEAHLTLSALYGNPEVPAEKARDVTRMLDQMAAIVIYSRTSFTEPPYRVQPGDTLEKIADSYSIPPELLARINGIRDSRQLQPGRELKVVRGPFSALVDLAKYEMTLMIKGRYAGRFPIGVGLDQPKLEGSYMVRDKKPSGDPNGPLGKYVIDLGNDLGKQAAIHGTNDPQAVGRAGSRGAICLAERDIEDVFGILSVGSTVLIRR